MTVNVRVTLNMEQYETILEVLVKEAKNLNAQYVKGCNTKAQLDRIERTLCSWRAV